VQGYLERGARRHHLPRVQLPASGALTATAETRRTAAGWRAGDISYEVFRRYVWHCVRDRTLKETKDRYGLTWYRRP
jgi:hypothetical protein